MKSILLLAGLAVAHAQSPAFDVASIKLSPPDAGSTGSRGGPGTKTPGVWTCQNMSLYNIVWIAFNLRSQQLIAPDWMNEPRFDITAKIPEGATREQFYLMFQNMLAERFSLKVHHDRKEVQGYELTVAKNGPKFKESSPEPPKNASPPVPQPPSLGPDGFPVAIPGISGVSITRNRARGQWLRAKMERLVRDLDFHVGKPVVDATGLKGTYDLSLYWVPDSMRPDAGEPTIFGALQNQLGLKLESKKVMIPVVVVDHAEKVPTEN
ncbi:conserved exported hypothetical protein [Candidatus Sulfopaludibacter sp. SbA6]|nr:conserved exported hypothetical protein [Candidatus Sulfopaludibacter sp. SbA6]